MGTQNCVENILKFSAFALFMTLIFFAEIILTILAYRTIRKHFNNDKAHVKVEISKFVYFKGHSSHLHNLMGKAKKFYFRSKAEN